MGRIVGLVLRVVAVLMVGVAAACALPAEEDGVTAEPPAKVQAAQPAPVVATTAASPTEVGTSSAAPVVEVKTVNVTQSIPFKTTRINDSSLPQGTTRVRTQGVNGSKTLTYEVTFTDGVETSRKLIREVVTKQPVTKVIRVGTKEPSCDPNYTGACVPIASDVDCAGGSGNGPAYVDGPVRVVGTDIYGLDHDNDGIGCE
jgi:hypothetical protein